MVMFLPVAENRIIFDTQRGTDMGLVGKLRTLRTNLLFRYGPPVARWIVDQRTKRAQAKIAQMGTLKILIDGTVLYHAVTHETKWISTGPQAWGPLVRDTGYMARVPVHPEYCNSREAQHVRYLTGIQHLCRLGLIELYTSAELNDEQFNQAAGRYNGYGYYDHSLFRGIPIKSVDGNHPASAERRLFDNITAKEHRERRFEGYLSDPAYADLVKYLGKSNSQDAWHIHTANTHDMFCYLTMDFKIIETIKGQKNAKPVKSLKTRIMTPKDLGDFLGIPPISPVLFSFDDASFPVRTSVTMPDARRRDKKQYKR